jgi:cyclophilin family peptidyl-prolyl cis-trans isomerase/HEAT repeat protein
MTPAAARAAIMAAEDRRLPLPDDLHTPAIDTLRGLQAEDVRLLLLLARATDATKRRYAIRALGRYERRELTPELQLIMASQTMNGETMNAVAQSLRGPVLPLDMTSEQIDRFFHAEFLGGVDPARDIYWATLPTLSRTIGRLPYTNVAEAQTADEFFTKSFWSIEPDIRYHFILPDLARGAETRARLSAKFGPLSDALTVALRGVVNETRRRYLDPVRIEAMSALVTSRGLDEETLRRAASDRSPEIRRLAALSIAGTGSPLAASERADTLIAMLADSSMMVRLEAARAWARRETPTNGCIRLIWALADRDLPVILTILDSLGDQCRNDTNVTDRLTVEARTPHPIEWHRPAHAFVALAKRAPERSAIAMGVYATSLTWQVRMYAARAAAIMNDVPTLERLALDPVDNVREAALPALRRLKKRESDWQFISALARSDYQLIRTASRELKGATPTPELAGALADALRRVTADRKDTSRDVRLELLERLRELGDENQAGAVEPLLRDFDIEVARSAGETLALWTGKAQEVSPAPLPRPPLPSAGELSEAAELQARVRLHNGKTFWIRLLPETAPLNCTRFLRLGRAGYYNGLTFHRVVPNFIVQGGSPGANEYSGDGPYVRDEISLVKHSRGTVGLSTRGRDTGDAQFFINLVDNPRLDFEYTVFGHVIRGMDVVDEILEGDAIEAVTFERPARDSKAPAAVRAPR